MTTPLSGDQQTNFGVIHDTLAQMNPELRSETIAAMVAIRGCTVSEAVRILAKPTVHRNRIFPGGLLA